MNEPESQPNTLVTDAVRAWIGREVSFVAPELVGRAPMRYFAIALGADPDIVPPTFVCETSQFVPTIGADRHGYLGHSWAFPFPVPCRLIRGGHDYEFGRPLRADDIVHTSWTVLDAVERRTSGQPMAVVTSRGTFAAADGEWLGTNTETLLYLPEQHPPERHVPERQHADHVANDGPIPDLVRTLTSTDLVAYGAATWDWHRLHHDDRYARDAGMAGPVVDGQMFGALLAHQVTAAFGPTTRIHRVHFRLRRPVTADTTIHCSARITARDGNRLSISQQVVADGELVVGPAGTEATVDRPV